MRADEIQKSETRPSHPVVSAILLTAISLVPTGVVFAQDVPWRIETSESRVTVSVFPAGLLSGALHTHFFRPTDWGGEIGWDHEHPDRVRVEVHFASGSLKDHQEKLSAKDIAKVERQLRSPRILDAERYPRILFEGGQLEDARLPPGGEGEFRATLAGTLTLHGVSRPLRFPIQGRVSRSRLEASGSANLKQTEFGIPPYSTALGTVAVKDEVTVEISLVAVPSASGDAK